MSMAAFEGLLAETVAYQGHNDDQIEGYFARPLGVASAPGVVVIHHGPGWDAWTREVARKFADHGYAAIAPNLVSREGPGTNEERVERVRAAGGVPDDRCVGDVEASVRYLRALPYSNGKVGVIGCCSGGRQTYMSACKIPSLDAAVDCWGGRVIPQPADITPRQPVPVIDMTPDLACPLLGLFGAEDLNPSPEQVAKIEAELQRYNKVYEFHTYENAGHGFFAVDRPSYRQHAALDGWEKVFAWFGKYLQTAS
jgi:carboxymethylenebutenolidase